MKALEENGIGRPSTYGQILTTIQARDYTYKHDGKFHPTHLGVIVTMLLKQSFSDILDEKYTAKLEEDLDDIEDGKLEWKQAVADFDVKFSKDLETAGEHWPHRQSEAALLDRIGHTEPARSLGGDRACCSLGADDCLAGDPIGCDLVADAGERGGRGRDDLGGRHDYVAAFVR